MHFVVRRCRRTTGGRYGHQSWQSSRRGIFCSLARCRGRERNGQTRNTSCHLSPPGKLPPSVPKGSTLSPKCTCPQGVPDLQSAMCMRSANLLALFLLMGQRRGCVLWTQNQLGVSMHECPQSKWLAIGTLGKGEGLGVKAGDTGGAGLGLLCVKPSALGSITCCFKNKIHCAFTKHFKLVYICFFNSFYQIFI